MTDQGMNRRQLARDRAVALGALRSWAGESDLLEVDVPLAVPSPCIEPHLDGPEVRWAQGSEKEPCFLPTSPEMALKKLVAEGIGSCFSLGPVFRDEPLGRLHIKEFLMFEWYRLEPSLACLAEDLGQILARLSNVFGTHQPWQRKQKTFFPQAEIKSFRYQDLMEKFAKVDLVSLMEFSPKELATWGEPNLEVSCKGWSLDDILAYLFMTRVEPHLGWLQPVLVTHYPASQAALSALDPADNRWALRAELFLAGVELANGYVELTDHGVYQQRVSTWQEERCSGGNKPHPLDPAFERAMASGLPPCSGMALGVDRLLMLLWNLETVGQTRLL